MSDNSKPAKLVMLALQFWDLDLEHMLLDVETPDIFANILTFGFASPLDA
jgi:hypothetical protein